MSAITHGLPVEDFGLCLIIFGRKQPKYSSRIAEFAPFGIQRYLTFSNISNNLNGDCSAKSRLIIGDVFVVGERRK